MRRDGLTAGPQIVHAVSSQWIDGGAARFALDLATAGRMLGDRIADAEEEIESRWNALQAAEAARARTEERATSAASTAAPSISRADHESILRGERTRARALEERLARLQGERNAMATRERRLRSRIDALTARLASAQDRLETLEPAIASNTHAASRTAPSDAPSTTGDREPGSTALAKDTIVVIDIRFTLEV